MWLQVLLLIAGLALLIKGGDWFVTAAVRAAGFLRMPRVVIGSTLVSLATTMPELVVSVMAGARGEPGLAVGNAIGSCICNIGLILGLTATLKHVDVHLQSLRVPLIAMFACGALLFLMSFHLALTRSQGLVLIACGLGYFVYDFAHHARDRKPADVAEAAAVQAAEARRMSWFRGKTGSVIQFCLGAGIVVLGSRLLVGSAVNLAHALGISSLLIGLTIVAVGTSLPELITAVTSYRKNVSDLAIGNVLGANIANLTFIVGTAAAFSPVAMNRATALYNFPALLVFFSLLLWMLFTDRRVTRKEGVTLLVCYVFYIGGLVLMSGAFVG